MTRLRREPTRLDVDWTDVFRVTRALDFATRAGPPTEEALERLAGEHNAAWGTDAAPDEYLAAVVAAADAAVETGEGGGAVHLVDEPTRRRRAGERRDELRRLLAD